MPGKGVAAETAANRCQCGHFPSTHMIVRSGVGESAGSFVLVPEGPCVRCGGACVRFRPTAT